MRIHPLIIIFLFTFILAACGSGETKSNADNNHSEATNDSDAIRIAVLPTMDALPLFAAKKAGMLDSMGVKVRLVPFNASMDIDTALIGGSVDGAFTDVVRVMNMQKKHGLKFHEVAVTAQQWHLVSNRVARLSKLEQMGDKMVAAPRFSAVDYLTDISFDDVKTKAPVFRVQINDINIRLMMLLNNELDAAWLPQPQAAMAEAAGHRLLCTSEQKCGPLGVLVFRQSFADSNEGKERVKKFGEVWEQISQKANADSLSLNFELLNELYNVDTTQVKLLTLTKYPKSVAPADSIKARITKYLNK